LGTEGGFTLIELTVVVGIIAILVVALGMNFVGWRERYRVESEARKLHYDLMDARARSIQRRHVHFIVLGGDNYKVYEDTDTAPDGDGALNTAAGKDTLIADRTLEFGYTMEFYNAATGAFSNSATIGINTSGRLATTGTVRIKAGDETEKPDLAYDCVSLDTTRLNLGFANIVESGGVYEWDTLGSCTEDK
jgi:prepilin-type N-terminal cleavage/methylation domain-containing protein